MDLVALVSILGSWSRSPLAKELALPVIEDNAFADLSITGEAPLPIASLMPGEAVLTLGLMNKLFWQGLRVGWIRASATAIFVGSGCFGKGYTTLGSGLGRVSTTCSRETYFHQWDSLIKLYKLELFPSLVLTLPMLFFILCINLAMLMFHVKH